MSRNVASTLRTALTMIVPFALLLPLVARDLANVIYGWLAAADAYPDYELPLSLFGLGIVFFTVHFLVLRGYYSLERTRTVFWVQCVIAATNIGLALLFTRTVASGDVASGLVAAYAAAYAVGAASPTCCSATCSVAWRPRGWSASSPGCCWPAGWPPRWPGACGTASRWSGPPGTASSAPW